MTQGGGRDRSTGTPAAPPDGRDPRAVIPGFATIAHRGASGHAPEATEPAFERAVAMGADYLELDIQMSRDGRLVAIHDTTLDRTTSGSGPVGERTLAELQALDAGAWFNRSHPERADPAFAGVRLMTLEEIVARFGVDERYYIETKAPELYPGVEDALAEVLRAHGLVAGGGAVLQSFSEPSLQRLRALVPEAPRVQLLYCTTDGGGIVVADDHGQPVRALGDDDLARIAAYAAGIGINHVHAGGGVIGPAFVRRAHAAGLLVHVYTVDDEAAMERLIDWGVDGIFTNFPDRLAAVRERRGR